MRLRDFSKRILPDETPDFAYVLQGSLDISELTEEALSGFPETVYIANNQSAVFGKIQRDILLFLLKRQRAFDFVRILDSINDGVIALDETGRIFYANPAYTTTLGVPLRRIMGKYIQDVEPDSLLNQAFLQRTTFTSEKQLIHSIKKYVSLRAFPLWEGDRFQGAVSIFRDVTKIHIMGQEMRQMSGIVDEYSQKIRSQETAEKLGMTSYNKGFQNTIQRAATVALTDVPLLICGESGTGKSAMAHYLHQCSSHRDAPIITVNCSAVPTQMIEDELFGNQADQQGKFALAKGGTLFLDEIGDLSLQAQAQLLTMMQWDRIDTGESRKETVPDVRLIASTSQALEQMVQERRFRQELFFQLNTITVRIPPLRDRPDDIIPLANRFLSQCNEKYHRDMVISAQTYQDMQAYSWPGNLGELKSYVERMVILSNDSPFTFMKQDRFQDPVPNLTQTPPPREGPLRAQVRAFETVVLQETLTACGGSRTAAMQTLGLSRRTFYRKCRELGILNSDEK